MTCPQQTTISISDLVPFQPFPTNSTLEAEISLVWPYSSSHASLAYLLVDPDPRNAAGGRVRVAFHGKAAAELAKAHAGIGDVICLDLASARWRAREAGVVSTPRRGLDGELVFDAACRVLKKGAWEVLVADKGRKETGGLRMPETPRIKDRKGDMGTRGLDQAGVVGVYSSPSFMKRLRLSQGMYVDSPGLTLVGDRLDSGSARKRRRTEYRYVRDGEGSPIRANGSSAGLDLGVGDVESDGAGDAAPTSTGASTVPVTLEDSDSSDVEILNAFAPEHDRSSHIQTLSADTIADVNSAVTQSVPSQSESIQQTQPPSSLETTERPIDKAMAPPPLPPLQMPRQSFEMEADVAGPITPKLVPVAGATLPMPSPFPQTSLARTTAIAGGNDGAGSAKPSANVSAGDYFGEILSRSDDYKAEIEDIQPDEPVVYETAVAASQVDSVEPSAHPRLGPSPAPLLLDDGQIDGHVSPSSGSDADVSGEEADMEVLQPPSSNNPTAVPEIVNEQQEIVPPSDNGRTSSPDESEESSILEEEAEDSSDIPSPSDDEEAYIDAEELTRLHPLEIEDSASDSSMSKDDQETLLGGIGAMIQPAEAVTESSSRSPSKLPVLNEHHPFGLDELLPGKDQVIDHREQSGPDQNAEPDSSQDESAAWAAMDEAMHAMPEKSHEMDQAPAIPLTSTLAPSSNLDHGLSAESIFAAVRPERIEHVRHGQDSEAIDESPIPITATSGISRIATVKSVEMINYSALDGEGTKRSPSVEVVDLTELDDTPFKPQAVRSGHQESSADIPVAVQSIRSDAQIYGKVSQDLHKVDTDPKSESSVGESKEAGSDARSSARTIPFSSHNLVEEPSDEDLQPLTIPRDSPSDLHGAVSSEQKGPSNDHPLQVDVGRRESDEIIESAKETTIEATGEARRDRVETSHPKLPLVHDKRRGSSRLSLVPDSLDSWFIMAKPGADRRRKTIHVAARQQQVDAVSPPAVSLASPLRESPRRHPRSISPPPLKRYSQSTGRTTELTYLTPLTNLDLYLNMPTTKIDVLAVATAASAEPSRAKAGPRDWYTILRITDIASYQQESDFIATRADSAINVVESLPSSEVPNNARPNAHTTDAANEVREDIRVEIFRPWKASLPQVAAGDVMLLRGFVIRSRQHRTYLLSGEESGWCVWRYDTVIDGNAPTRARKEHGAGRKPREEMKGPPVEVGSCERKAVKELRLWWERIGGHQRKGKGRATL